MPLVSRTRATLRSAEFGFLGVFVYTRVHTPRRWGAPFRAAVLPLSGLSSRPLRTSCWMVGTALQGGGSNGDRPSYGRDRKSTRLNSSHANTSYAVFCLKK